MSINYIGSKKTLKAYIADTIKRHVQLDSSTVVGEGFAGTGVLGQYLHELHGCSIICADTERYSWLLCTAILNVPFSERLSDFIGGLNALEGEPKWGLVSKTYSPKGDRMFFTESNARAIDRIREEIETLRSTISRDEYMFLLASLVVSADKVANVSCVYGSFLKQFKVSARKPFVLTPIHTVKSLSPLHIVHHACVLDVNWSTCDVVYLDPPYNQRQYGANYFVLNYIIEYSEQRAVRGKTGLTEYYKSPFSKKTHCMEAFRNLLNHLARVPVIVLSYNNEGILSSADLQKLLCQYGQVTCYTKKYKKFKAQASVGTPYVFEYVWVVETSKSGDIVFVVE